MATTNPYILIPPCTGGQRADLDQKSVPTGSMYRSMNWVLQDGVFRVRNGFTAFGTSVAERVLAVAQYDHNDGNKRTVLGVPTKWFSWDLSALDWVDITDALDPLTGTYNSVQNFRNFYKSGVCYLVGVNGHADSPKAWNGTDANYTVVGGTPYAARCVAVCANRMLLGNLYIGAAAEPCAVDVSAFNDFESGWLGVTQLTQLTDTPGIITEMREFGNLNTAIYKTDAIYLAIAQSATYPFAFQLVQAGIRGPLNSRAVVSTPSAHYFLSPDCNVYMFNGYQVTPLPNAIQSQISATADINSLKLAYGYYRSQKKELRFAYPEKLTGDFIEVRIRLEDNTVWPTKWGNANPSMALESIIEDATLISDLISLLSTYTDAIEDWRSFREQTLVAGYDGQIYEVDSALTDDNGNPIDASLETGMVAQPDNRQYFTTQESEHFFNVTPAAQAVSVQLGVSETGEDPVYGAASSIALASTTPRKLGHRVTSRMFSLKLSVAASTRVHWRGSQVNGIPRGYR